MISANLNNDLRVIYGKNNEFNKKVAEVASNINSIPTEASDHIKMSSILCKVNNNKALGMLRRRLMIIGDRPGWQNDTSALYSDCKRKL